MVDPFFIFKQKTPPDPSLAKGSWKKVGLGATGMRRFTAVASQRCCFAAESGWMTENLWVEYLEWLRDHLPPRIGKAVLFVDQHSSRFSLAALEKAKEL